MPIRVLFNRCPEIMALFAGEGVDRMLAQCAAKGAENATASLGEGPEVSSPGDAPNSQSGDLKAEITSSDNLTQSNSGHSGFLELGTRRMAARPFLLKACVDVQTSVVAIVHETLGI